MFNKIKNEIKDLRLQNEKLEYRLFRVNNENSVLRYRNNILQRRVDSLESLLNKIDTYSLYPKIPKETHRTLGVHEFEVSNRVTFEEIKKMLDLNFKNHYDIFICGSEHSNTAMVTLIFDGTYYNDKAVKSLKNIKEYLKHNKR